MYPLLHVRKTTLGGKKNCKNGIIEESMVFTCGYLSFESIATTMDLTSSCYMLIIAHQCAYSDEKGFLIKYILFRGLWSCPF